MSRVVALVTVLAALSAWPAAARAQVQSGVPEVFPSKHELSAHLGFQAGFGGQLGSTSGFKLDADYAYRFHPYIWFDAALGNVFGFGSADGQCAHSVLATCYRGGWDLELMAGIKLKFPTRIPLVIEAPALVGVEVLYNRDCGDDGAAVPVIKTGGGVMYFLTKKKSASAASSTSPSARVPRVVGVQAAVVHGLLRLLRLHRRRRVHLVRRDA